MYALDILILIVTICYGFFSYQKLRKKIKEESRREMSLGRDYYINSSNIN